VVPSVVLVVIQIHQQAQHQQHQQVVQPLLLLLHRVMHVLFAEIKHRENIMEFIGMFEYVANKIILFGKFLVAKVVKVFLNVLYVKI
jgi:endonuclease III